MSNTIDAVPKINENYEVQEIPMDQIFHDPEFNCRGHIIPGDVIDLVKDIDANGLRDPIIVQPYSNKDYPQYKYRIVAGHRRHVAHKVLKKQTINARVFNDLNEIDAHKINLKENLSRKQLNILQEANALKIYKDNGWTINLVAEEFQQTHGWVQVRYMLLELPKEIQEVAAAGLLTQPEIRHIYSIKDHTKRIEAVKKIKEVKLRRDRYIIPKEVEKVDAMKLREPVIGERKDMLDKLYDITGPGLHTRVLAWSVGNISLVELYNSIEEYCKENNIKFTMPAFIQQQLLKVG